MFIVKIETRDYDLLERFKQYKAKTKVIKRTLINEESERWEWEFWFQEEKDANRFYNIVIDQNEMPDQVLSSKIEYSDVFK